MQKSILIPAMKAAKITTLKNETAVMAGTPDTAKVSGGTLKNCAIKWAISDAVTQGTSAE